jgi:trehalose/maltose transport system substrate-binding protein
MSMRPEEELSIRKKGRENVKRIAVLVATGLSGLFALSLGGAAAGSAGPAAQGPAAQERSAAVVRPPAVPNARAIRARYRGKSIAFVGDNAVGSSHRRDLLLVARFQRDTGIKVKLIPHPAASDASYAQLARNFSSKSSSIDVMMLDVVWPGAFAPYLVNLKPRLAKEARQHSQGIIQNNTIGGRLIAMPWFGDYGILYYRTDLLRKYGYRSPPKTWAELGSMARRIQNGERQSNDNFYGYVYQGNAYEGLTCNALEWLASSGGGNFIDGGEATIDNPRAVQMLNLQRSWVGEITPRGVTSYDEEGARNAFASGNAAFLRNWPYAYSANQDSPVKGKFDVTVLPHGAGAPSVGTVGGWQLGVSRFSKNIPAATELVRYLTSPAVQRFNAIYNSNVPTIPAVATNRAVVRTNPYLKPAIAKVKRVTRPSRFLKGRYNQGSQIIYQGVNQILNGQDARNVLPSVEQRLNRLLR